MIFVIKTHDPAVCMSSKDRNIKTFTSKYIRSTITTTDHGSTGTISTSIRSLSTSKSEFHNTTSTSSINYTRSLRSDQTLMIDDIKERSFYKLCLHDRCFNFQKRFSWEYNSSFRDRINISCKMISSKIFQKIFIKNPLITKIINIII